MYDGETVNLILYALEEGMGVEEASGLCGVGPRAAYAWAAGRLPCSHVSSTGCRGHPKKEATGYLT